MTLVILAAGMGSRYGGLKQLDPMTEYGEFILDFSVFDAKKAGFDKVVFVIKKELEELFKETVGHRIEKQMKVEYVYQDLKDIPAPFTVMEGREKPWGTGHALLTAREAVGEDNFAVLNADDFYGRDAFVKVGEFLKDKKKDSTEYCMAGYIVKNTLTEHGSVSRGVTETTKDGYLESIAERTKIYKDEKGQIVYEEEGKTYPVSDESTVSMNFWGFTPAIFEGLEREFKVFLENLKPTDLKKEFYLPVTVNTLKNAGECSVKVLTTTAKWLGVTYPEDKERVVKSLNDIIKTGEYPSGLWNN